MVLALALARCSSAATSSPGPSAPASPASSQTAANGAGHTWLVTCQTLEYAALPTYRLTIKNVSDELAETVDYTVVFYDAAGNATGESASAGSGGTFVSPHQSTTYTGDSFQVNGSSYAIAPSCQVLTSS